MWFGITRERWPTDDLGITSHLSRLGAGDGDMFANASRPGQLTLLYTSRLHASKRNIHFFDMAITRQVEFADAGVFSGHNPRILPRMHFSTPARDQSRNPNRATPSRCKRPKRPVVIQAQHILTIARQKIRFVYRSNPTHAGPLAAEAPRSPAVHREGQR